MEPFATIAELETRWRPIAAADKDRAKTKLSDASVIVARECKRAGVDLDVSDELAAADVSMIVCEMVKRAMIAPVDQVPVSQSGITAGPFSEQQTYINPTGDLYLTNGEKRRLGIVGQRIGSIAPQIGGAR